jgi:sporulation integral membrane protein YtvI
MSIKTLFFAAIIILFFYGLFTVGFPFLLAFFVAFLIDPLIRCLTKKTKMKRIFAALLVCTGITLLLLGLLYFLITRVSREIVALSKVFLSFSIEINMDWLNNQYLDFLQKIPPQYNTTMQEITKTLLGAVQNLVSHLGSYFFNLAAAIPSIFLQAIIFFLAFYLICINLPTINRNFMKIFDPSVHNKVKSVLIKLNNTVFGFVRAQLIISFLIFCVVLIGFLIMGINYPSALALLVTVVDILPVFGTGSVMIPMAIYYLLIGKTYLFWGLLAHYAFIVIFRRIIEPKILAENIGLTALSTLVSMYVGFSLVGVIGLFLGPFLLIFYQALVKVGIVDIKIKF